MKKIVAGAQNGLLNRAKLRLGLAKQASTTPPRGLYNRSLKPTTKDPLKS